MMAAKRLHDDACLQDYFRTSSVTVVYYTLSKVGYRSYLIFIANVSVTTPLYQPRDTAGRVCLDKDRSVCLFVLYCTHPMHPTENDLRKMTQFQFTLTPNHQLYASRPCQAVIAGDDTIVTIDRSNAQQWKIYEIGDHKQGWLACCEQQEERVKSIA